MPTYCMVTLQEMDDYFTKQYGQRFTRYKESPGTEWIYSIVLSPLVTVKVYSSIVDTISREAAQDAIRVVLLGAVGNTGHYKALAKQRRVNRVAGWERNLTARLSAVHEAAALVKQCPRCSSAMQVRVNKQTIELFYGCLAWPECTATLPYKGVTYAAQT